MSRKNNRGQRKAKPTEPQGKFKEPILTHMRKVAFHDLRIEAQRTMTHAERLRDDEGMLAAAEAKRQRKAAKVAGK